ncbi:ATPase associated with various cellular activities AAA_5 [Thiocapsa marina 5811]|uniref:ATPase associated with various cellular activities AAA_5 n=1 Tax=Thiocapsa marina 5811 TaxID=768671 RepID=F9UHX2_9GAMM|nr:ATPase associated with various cellular activities AAA_5 [Thiocapsa marina 5811]
MMTSRMTSLSSIELGGKHVFLSPSYDAGARHAGDLIGHEDVLRTVLAAWQQQPGMPPMAPLLVGPPGVGKNHIVYELARITGKRLWILQGHEDVTADDISCAVRSSDDPTRKFDYILASPATAMHEGGIVLFDEIGKMRPRALAPLASVTDERRTLFSNLLGDGILAHPGFRFIAATNSVDLDAEGLPDFIRSRLQPVIQIGLPGRREIGRIVRSRFERIGAKDELMSQFWRLWDAHRDGTLPSPRETLHVFGLAMGLADVDAGLTDEATDRVMLMVQPRHLEEAFLRICVNTRATT